MMAPATLHFELASPPKAASAEAYWRSPQDAHRLPFGRRGSIATETRYSARLRSRDSPRRWDGRCSAASWDGQPRASSSEDLSHMRACRLLRSVAGRQAAKHYHATRHPIIEGYDPPEGGAGAMSMKRSVRSLRSHDAPQRPDPALLLSEGVAACAPSLVIQSSMSTRR